MRRLPERERGRSGGYEIGSACQRALMPPPLRCESFGCQPAHTAARPQGVDVSAVHAARARHRGEEIGRRLGAFHGPRFIQVIAIHQPPLRSDALIAAVTETIVTLGGHMLGQSVCHHALDAVIDALVPRLRSRAHREAEESEERLVTAAGGHAP